MAKKLYSLLLALCLTLLISINYIYLTQTKLNLSRERAIIARVIDGDTIVLTDNRTIRLLNINSPEKSSILSSFAYNFLKQYENKSVELVITDTDKYGRSLAKIFAPDYLNFVLVKSGLASKFLVQKDELKLFNSAERQAVEEEKGIWKKSPYYGCILVSVLQDEEIIHLQNKCPPFDVVRWVIKDESRKSLELPSLDLIELNIHSSIGISNFTDIFWNSSTSIWNDDRDTIYLFDERNRIAAHYSYGY